jgi:hypothetical protein
MTDEMKDIQDKNARLKQLKQAAKTAFEQLPLQQ